MLRSCLVTVVVVLAACLPAALFGASAEEASDPASEAETELTTPPGAPPVSPLAVSASVATSAPRLTWDLAAVLALARRHGREARLAQEELAAAYQKMNFVNAGYHPTGQATTVDPENRALRLDQKLNEGTRATVNMTQSGTGDVHRTWTMDHQLFINNAFDVRLANLTFAVAREAFRQRMETYKLDVITRFFDLVRAQLRYRTLTEGVGRARDLVASAKARYDLGTTSKLDVLNTGVELAAAENDLLAQAQVVDSTRDLLLDGIGLPLDTPADVSDALKLERPGEPEPGWYRSELAEERGRVELARTNLNQAKYEARPDMRVTSVFDEDAGRGQRDVTTTLRYNFPIGTAPSDHTYRQLKHVYASAELAFQNREFQIAREQRDIRRTLNTKEQSVRIAQLALSSATEAFEASQISFARGLISNIDLRTAQANLTRARDSYLNLLIDYRVAVFTYKRLFGGEL